MIIQSIQFDLILMEPMSIAKCDINYRSMISGLLI